MAASEGGNNRGLGQESGPDFARAPADRGPAYAGAREHAAPTAQPQSQPFDRSALMQARADHQAAVANTFKNAEMSAPAATTGDKQPRDITSQEHTGNNLAYSAEHRFDNLHRKQDLAREKATNKKNSFCTCAAYPFCL